jgi:hypothetical protein
VATVAGVHLEPVVLALPETSIMRNRTDADAAEVLSVVSVCLCKAAVSSCCVLATAVCVWW